MGAECHKYTPEAADQRSAQDHVKSDNGVVHYLDGIADIDSHRPQDAESNGNHDDQRQPRNQNHLKDLRDHFFQQFFQIFQHNHHQNDGDDGLRIAEDPLHVTDLPGSFYHGNAQHPGNGGRVLHQIVDLGIYQKAADGHGRKLAGL